MFRRFNFHDLISTAERLLNDFIMNSLPGCVFNLLKSTLYRRGIRMHSTGELTKVKWHSKRNVYVYMYCCLFSFQ